MQSLECRCVMDASGFEMGTEIYQDIDTESSVMFQSASSESSEGTSTEIEQIDETVDPDSAKVMYFSVVDHEFRDLPTIDLSESESGEGTTTDNVLMGETVDPVIVICDLPTIDLSETEPSDEFVVDVDMVKRSVDETDVTDETGVVDETIFQTFGVSSQDDEMMETTAFHGVTFDFDIDQNGSLSRLDAEMLISYLSELFRSEGFAAFAQSDSSEMLQMDVDGDAQLTPLDALIVINELNRSGTLEANASSGSSRLAANSTLIASGDLRIRDMQDDSLVDAASLDEDRLSDDSATVIFGKMSVAQMTDLAISDFAPSFEASRLAGYKSLTSAKQDGTPFIISVDDNGKVTAASDSLDLEVSIGEDQVISVDGESSGLAVVDFGGGLLLSKQAQADIGLMFA